MKAEGTPEAPPPVAREVIRLNTDVYRAFEASMPGAVIDKAAADAGADAAFKLGVQYVLKRLRDELVTR
jgi:hypothetical protein